MVKNRRGSALVFYLMAFFVFFLVVSPVSLDFMNTIRVQNRIKTVSDIAAKSASFKIKSGDTLAEGKFYINEQKAVNTISKLLRENFSLTDDADDDDVDYEEGETSDGLGTKGTFEIDNSDNTTGNPIQSMSITVNFYKGNFYAEGDNDIKKPTISGYEQKINFPSGGLIVLEVDTTVRTFFGRKLYRVVSFSTSRLDSIYNIP